MTVNKYRMLVIACVLLLLLIPSVSATSYIWNSTFASNGGSVYGGENYTVNMNRSELCAQYGMTTYQGNYWMELAVWDSLILTQSAANRSWVNTSGYASNIKGATSRIPVNVTSGKYFVESGSCSDVNVWVGYYYTYYPNGTRPETANFSGTPTALYAGGNVTFSDTSIPNIGTTQVWTFGDGQIINGTHPTTSHQYLNAGIYSVRLDTLISGIWYNITKPNYITITASPVSNTTMWFAVMDSATHNRLATISTVGIQNLTSGVWRNSTPTGTNGLFYLTDTGANHEYPVTSGELVGIDITAPNYVDALNQSNAHAYNTVTVADRPSDNPYPILMTKTSDIIYNGSWNLDVYLTDATTGDPIVSGVTLTLRTGLNGWCASDLGCAPNVPNDGITGLYSFRNVTASTIASLTSTSQAYNNIEESITILLPTNYTTTKYYALVRKGAQWTITPTSTTTGGTTTSVTTVGTLVQPTDANGNIITDSTEKGIAAFSLLVDAAYTIMGIAVGCLLIWLMWMVVYLITGGKIIDKIMKRGRGGKR